MDLCRKNMVLAIMAVFLFLFGWGAATTHLDEIGNMSNCPWMGLAAICQMNIFEHLSIFQSIFRMAPSKIIFLTFLFLTVFLFASRRNPSYLLNNLEILSKHWTDLSFRILPLTSLRRALAAGILNPKIY